MSGVDVEDLMEENVNKLNSATFSASVIEGDSELTTFYTGLPEWPIILSLSSIRTTRSITQSNE